MFIGFISGQPKLPAPDPLFVSLEDETDIVQAKIGLKGKTNVLTTQELIVLAAVRQGPLPH